MGAELFKKILRYISEELCDAEKYISHALNVKSTEPQLAKLFMQLSDEEMEHANRLNKQCLELMTDDVRAIYEYAREEHVEKAKAVRIMQSMYKEE